MDNFLYTCPTNQFFAGRKFFSLGEFYNNLPSKADAQAAVTSCPSPGDGYSPPYANLRYNFPVTSTSQFNVNCSRVIIWPRLIKSSGAYSEGLDTYFVYSCNNATLDTPGDTIPPIGINSLPGDLQTVLSPPDITLEPNTGINSVYIREDNSGSYDYTITCFGTPETSTWLATTSEWMGSIIPSIYNKDYARDNAPHAAGLFFSTQRWLYSCFDTALADPSHSLVFDDPALSICNGGCFFLEDLTALYTP